MNFLTHTNFLSEASPKDAADMLRKLSTQHIFQQRILIIYRMKAKPLRFQIIAYHKIHSWNMCWVKVF